MKSLCLKSVVEAVIACTFRAIMKTSLLTPALAALLFLGACQRATVPVPEPSPKDALDGMEQVCYKGMDVYLGQSYEEVNNLFNQELRTDFESASKNPDIKNYWLAENETLGVPGVVEYGSIPALYFEFENGVLTSFEAAYILGPTDDVEQRYACLRHLQEFYHPCLSEGKIEVLANRQEVLHISDSFKKHFYYSTSGPLVHFNYSIERP